MVLIMHSSYVLVRVITLSVGPLNRLLLIVYAAFIDITTEIQMSIFIFRLYRAN